MYEKVWIYYDLEKEDAQKVLEFKKENKARVGKAVADAGGKEALHKKHRTVQEQNADTEKL